jgi:CARDB/PLAT/LH2 domain
MSPHRPRAPRSLALAALTAATLLAAPAAAPAFDTGPHSDITRDALTAEGFGATAADVVVVNNWFVDLYSNSSKIPQSGHADTAVSVLGAFFENDESWPQAVLDGANRMHFDSSLWDVANVGKAQIEWDRLQRATTQLLGSITSVNGPNKEIHVLSTIGMGLHALQDFYSHSNWIEQQGVTGNDGTNWSTLTYGLTPTWFDVPKAVRDSPLNVYIGESTDHKKRKHGAWNTNGNTTMEDGVNKDWPGRPGYANAYTTSYFATRQWVRAIHTALGDEALWQRTLRYANRGGGELDHDLKGALDIGMTTGHWQGQGEPCDPSFSLNVCGSRNGLGGDLIGARSAVNSYFEDRGRTRFRGAFQGLIPLYGQPAPNGDLLPITSSQGLQATTRFVQMRVTSMKGVGLRALGDPTPIDRADMYSRATIAGQSFQSGEINGRDSFGFGLPYAPFTFIKAIGVGGRYAEPVTTMTVEIRTSSKTFAGTDDDVYLRIGPNLRFALDKSLYDDFERGDRDTYSVPIDGAVLAGLKVGDISRVQIEKSPDGAAGGWRLRGVKLVVNGRTLYARDGIERWLEDDHRTWRAPDFTQSGPGGAALPITLDLYDEDSNVYGGDDHGDLNRYDNRRRLALAYLPGTVAGDRATGGSFLSGRIGDGDKASVTYTIETLTPTPAPPPVLAPVVTPPPVVAPPPPPPPAPKPDLVISAIGYDEPVKYFFTVTNQGAAVAGPFSVDVPGEGSFPIAGLAPGASATRTFRTACKVATEQAIADALGQVAETDETNNTRSFTEAICVE